jgi:hypothetical protein
VSLDFVCTAHAFFPFLFNHCEGLRHTFLRDLHRIWCFSFVEFIVKSHQARYTIPKHQHFHPAAWNFVHWLPRYTSTIIYLYIALLQLSEMAAAVRKIMDTPSYTLFSICNSKCDRLCGLVVRVLGYRSGGPGSIPGTTKKK